MRYTQFTDKHDVVGLSKLINGGLNNIKERKEYTMWLKEFFYYSNSCE